MARATVTVRSYSDEDEALLWPTLEGACRGMGVPCRSLASWRWRYGQAPGGACVAFASEDAGQVIAGVVATRQRVLLEGREVAWLEVGDVFNDFGRGRGLDRARALLAAGEALAETFGGPAPERACVFYGLPDRRAHRIGRGRLEWEVLRSENVLRAPCAGLGVRPAGAVSIEAVERFPAEVEALIRAFAADRAAILVRDAAYLDWRYLQRPGVRPEIALGRVRGELRGYAVLRGAMLVDWVVPPGESGVAGELVAWAAERARAAGHPELSIVVPDTSPEWLALQELGFRAHGLPEYLCFRSFQRPAIMSWLFKHWYYTRGDIERET
jgi:hypothetical protein